MRKVYSLATKRIIKKISKQQPSKVLVRGVDDKRRRFKMRAYDPFLMPLTGEAAIKFEDQLRNAKRHDITKIIEEGKILSAEIDKRGIVRNR